MEQLTEFVRDYLSNEDSYKPNCDAGYHYAKETFNVSKNVDQLINLMSDK